MRKSATLLLAMVLVVGLVLLLRKPPTTVWPLGPPDLVVRLPAAVVIPPHEQDVFRNLVLPTGLASARFVRAIDIRPGDPAAVHHAVLKIDATPDARRRDEADPGPGFGGMDMGLSTPPEGHFLVWTPGKAPLAGGV